MFDMAKWDEYLMEYCQNAQEDGATPCDLAQMFQSAHTPQPFGRCSEWQ